MSEIERLTKRCAREKAARKQAEELLEQKSLELYELNKDLAEREEASRSILEATGDGIIIVDESGTIKMLNRAAKLIFGYVPAGYGVPRDFFCHLSKSTCLLSNKPPRHDDNMTWRLFRQ